jgi:xanthosine utilization system XapX-like protein
MERRGDLTGGGFGRRRASLTDAPSPPRSANASPAHVFAADDTGRRIAPLRLAGYGFGGLLGMLCIEAMLSNTSLITPIDETLRNVMRGIGLIVGVLLALFTVARPAEPMGALKKFAILLFLPVMTGFVGDQAAWRIADWHAFGLSSAEYHPTSYPITYASHGRRGRRDSFEIDPFDVKSGTDIAVPAAQFEAIWPHHGDYCITVMARRSASGAVEILNDGVFTLREPEPAVLTPCPAAKAGVAGDRGSPWDKKEFRP